MWTSHIAAKQTIPMAAIDQQHTKTLNHPRLDAIQTAIAMFEVPESSELDEQGEIRAQMTTMNLRLDESHLW
jgi:hypothetical protein